MNWLQLLWIVATDALLIGLALGAWSDFSESRDPVDLRYAAVFTLLAAVSVPLFFF